MSAAPTDETAVVEEKRKRGLSKYVSKVKSVLKKTDSTKRISVLSAKSPAASSSAAIAVRRSPAATTSDFELKDQLEVDTSSTEHPDLEKARKLAAKYGIELGPQTWKRPVEMERIEKPIRMRIHHTCHHCNTVFGANKVCVGCKHSWCEECPRYPKKKVPDEKSGGKAKEFPSGLREIAVGESAAETIEGPKKKTKYILSMPSKTGGQDLVRKKPMQRVRRTCHLCKTLYLPPNKICTGCSHLCCEDCPRDPPKKARCPYGYPGDVDVEDNSRSRSRYTCHSCRTNFKPGKLICLSCCHEKCAVCLRIPARKADLELDPEIVRRVQGRFDGLALDRTASPGTDPPGNE